MALTFGLAIAIGAVAACPPVVLFAHARTRLRETERALRRARDRETSVFDAALRFGSAACESVAAVRNEIARTMRSSSPIDGVLLYERREGALVCVAAFGDRFSYYHDTAIALDDVASIPVRALLAGHHIRSANIRAPAPHPSDRTILALPLLVGSEHPCVVVCSSSSEPDDETTARLVRLSELAAPAYLIALDREHDRRRAEYDALTGLLTPRALRQRLGALIDRARFVPSARLALLFVDTDHFKRWNDAYGHAAGDALLRGLAAVLRSTASRERDLVARNGGDEFCIAFAETDKAHAIERAEALRRSIAAIDLTALRAAAADAGVRITASIGVAAFPPDATTASELLECADEAMYHSKRTGRDGVSYRDAGATFTRYAAPLTGVRPSS